MSSKDIKTIDTHNSPNHYEILTTKQNNDHKQFEDTLDWLIEK